MPFERRRLAEQFGRTDLVSWRIARRKAFVRCLIDLVPVSMRFVAHSFWSSGAGLVKIGGFGFARCKGGGFGLRVARLRPAPQRKATGTDSEQA